MIVHRGLIAHYAREASLLFVSLATLLYFFGWIRVWLVGQIDTSTFAKILELLPHDLREMSPVDQAWLITYDGRIAFTFSEALVVLSVVAWALTRGSDVVSGQLGRGTLELILAQPVTRLQLLGSHTLITLAGGAALAVILWAGMATGIATVTATESRYPPLKVLGVKLPYDNVWAEPEKVGVPIRDKVDAATFLPGVRHLAALSVMFAGLATAASCVDRQRWRTIGLGIGFLIVSVLVKLVGRSVPETWGWLAYLSVFSLFEPELMVQSSAEFPGTVWSVFAPPEAVPLLGRFGPLGYDLGMVGLGAAGLAFGAAWFHRRDLPAPI